jgi:hypothetical protein
VRLARGCRRLRIWGEGLWERPLLHGAPIDRRTSGLE